MGIAEGSRGSKRTPWRSKGTPWGYKGVRRRHRGPQEVPGDQWVVQGLKGTSHEYQGTKGVPMD